MIVNYSIWFKGLYSDVFNTGYTRTIKDGRIVKDEFWGYFNYNPFNEKEKEFAHNEARQLLGNTINKIISDNIIDVNKYKEIASILNVKEFILNKYIYQYNDNVDFILTTTIYMED